MLNSREQGNVSTALSLHSWPTPRTPPSPVLGPVEHVTKVSPPAELLFQEERVLSCYRSHHRLKKYGGSAARKDAKRKCKQPPEAIPSHPGWQVCLLTSSSNSRSRKNPRPAGLALLAQLHLVPLHAPVIQAPTAPLRPPLPLHHLRHHWDHRKLLQTRLPPRRTAVVPELILEPSLAKGDALGC